MTRLAVAATACVILAACTSQAPRVGPIATRAPIVSTEAFLEITAASGRATFSVTYDVTGVNASGDMLRGRWVVYQRPPDMRIDVTQSTGDGVTEIRTWAVGDRVVICASPTQCEARTRAKEQTIGAGAQLEAELRARPRDFEVTRADAIAMAGRDAQCYRVLPKLGVRAQFREADVCYTRDGIPLMIRVASAEDDVTFRAIEASHIVSAADLLPPR